MTLHSPLIPAVVAIMMLILSACGGAPVGGPTASSAANPTAPIAVTSAPSAGTAPSSKQPTSQPAAASAGGFGNVDACKLLTNDDAKAALVEAIHPPSIGIPVVHATVLDSTSDGRFSEACTYGFALQKDGFDLPPDQIGKGGTMFIDFYPKDGAAWFKSNKGNDVKLESGVGDQFYLAGPSINVLKGDAAFTIAISGGDNALHPISDDRFKGLAQKAVNRLASQDSGPAPAPPKAIGPASTSVPTQPVQVAAPTEVVVPTPTESPAATALTTSIHAAQVAAQAGDLAKARAAYQPVDQQWAAIANDGKLVSVDIYPGITAAIAATDAIMASADTDAPTAASALGDLDDGVGAALATAAAASVAATVGPQLNAESTAMAGVPTPSLATSDKNPACGLIAKADADATLGGSSEVQSMPGSPDGTQSCRFYLSKQNGTVQTATLISIDYHPTGGARWYLDNTIRLTPDYRSGADIGDQFTAVNALQILVLKGDQSFEITMPPFWDFQSTPTQEMKALAIKAVAKLSP